MTMPKLENVFRMDAVLCFLVQALSISRLCLLAGVIILLISLFISLSFKFQVFIYLQHTLKLFLGRLG